MISESLLFIIQRNVEQSYYYYINYLWPSMQYGGRVVKALDLSSNGQMSAWVRTPPVLIFFTVFFLHLNILSDFNISDTSNETGVTLLIIKERE